ncbi:MAG TPA: hypothetical protein VN408_23460 [Actinoplanes sp.]|nr:hypothetical protein [Actinoplanes sp.]
MRARAEKSGFSPTSAFLRARRAWVPLIIAAVAGAVAAWAGHRAAAVPSVADNATLPLWRLLTMGVGILPALGLHSHLGSLEAMGTTVHRRAERRYLTAMVAAVHATFLGIAAAGLPFDVLAIAVRSIPGWLGLALLSGRTWGWRSAWILPVVTMCGLTFWGGGDGPADFSWWEFSARSHDDPRTLLLSAALGLSGSAAYAVTPWRLRRLRTAVSRWHRT